MKRRRTPLVRAADAVAGVVAGAIALTVTIAGFVIVGWAFSVVAPFVVVFLGGFVGMECAAAVRWLLRCPTPLVLGASMWVWGFGLLLVAFCGITAGAISRNNGIIEGLVVVVGWALVGLVDGRNVRKRTATPRTASPVGPPMDSIVE